jgi:hypothetical protein
VLKVPPAQEKLTSVNQAAVYGGAYYGSGYPYGGGGGWAVGQRPLPFIYWPVFIYPTNSYDSGIVSRSFSILSTAA